jgi:carbohydrate diacid regulator
MLNKENRNQLDKISSILCCYFGVADVEGRVCYSGSSNITEGDIISVPREGAEAYEEYDIVEQNGMSFAFHNMDDSEPVWFFISLEGDDREAEKRLLELALCAYDNRREVRSRRKAEFFRSLMTEGYSSVDVNDFNMYVGELSPDIIGYTVIIVSLVTSSYDPANLAVVEEFLAGIFPSKEGYFVIPADDERLCIICPLTEENGFEQLLENANLVSDTVLSELMISVSVAVGVVVNNIKAVDAAFRSAEKADTIGKMFEIPGKSFVYDKLGLSRLVYGMPKETCLAFLKETLGPSILEDKSWFVRPGGQEDEIKKTIKTFLDTNQNISETSRELYIHRNTLVYRLDKFNKMTGLDCTKFEDGMKVGMAMLVLQYLSKIQNKDNKN